MTRTTKPPFYYNKSQEIASEEFTAITAHELNKIRNQFISPDNILSYSHGSGWETNYPHSADNEGTFQQFSADTAIKYEDVVNHDVSVLLGNLNDLVNSMGAQFQRNLFQTVSETTEKTGNTVSAQDFPSTADAFLATFEKIKFGVDRNGEVTLPSIYLGSDMTKKVIDELESKGPEFEEKAERIKQEKIKEALAEEEVRISKFVNPEDSN